MPIDSAVIDRSEFRAVEARQTATGVTLVYFAGFNVPRFAIDIPGATLRDVTSDETERTVF